MIGQTLQFVGMAIALSGASSAEEEGEEESTLIRAHMG